MLNQDKVNPNAAGQAEPKTQDTLAGRPPAKLLLIEKMNRLQNELKGYQVILNMMPSNPTPEQDEALFNLFLQFHVR